MTQSDTITIPPRCEIIHTINLATTEDVIFDNIEIQPNVFIASSIANQNAPFVRLLNLSNFTQVVSPNFTYKLLKDYNVFQASAPTSINRSEQLNAIIKDTLLPNTPNELINLCQQYNDIFQLPDDPMSTNNFYSQHLRIRDPDPIYIKNYRLPHTQLTEIQTQVDNLLKNDAIEPSTSPYNSPMILVPKKSTDGNRKYRLCIDYRKLNDKLIPDKFPLPRIDEILDCLGRAKYFSVIDLAQGFHQIPINPDSRDYTSFSTPTGAYRWKVLPFGLNISPNSFSRMMSIAFSGLIPSTCFLYIDDIIVIGKSISHHLTNLEKVFNACRKFNLKLNPSKCQFFRHEVTYLGHRCTNLGILPDNAKLDSVSNYPTPTTKDEVKRFVAFSNYYRKFIPHFSTIAKPLNYLTKKSTPFIWSKQCEKSFSKLKHALINPPILAYPDFSQPFLLTVDASKNGCGAVLSQNFEGNDLPISYASKAYSPAESRKAPIELELIAINWAIKHYSPYLWGTKFFLQSDHKPLIYLYSLKNPTSRLTRLRLELEEYDFIITHIKGKDNVIADALSRISFNDIKKLALELNPNILVITRSMTRKNLINTNKNDAQPIITNDLIPNDIKIYETLNSNNLKNVPTLMCQNSTCSRSGQKYINFRLLTKRGSKPLINFNCKTSNASSLLEESLAKLNLEAGQLNIKTIQILKNNILFKYKSMQEFKETGNRILTNITIVIKDAPILIHDTNIKLAILKQNHEDPLLGGHSGRNKLFAKIRAKFYWKGLARDISKYVKDCHFCQTNKPKNSHIEPLEITTTSTITADRIIVDTIGPLEKSLNNNSYALTIICDLSKFLITIPIPNKESVTIAKALFENYILTFGTPKSILSDRGTEYVNKILLELTQIMNINHSTSTSYRHQTLGAIERTHRTLNEYLRTYLVSQPDWETNMKYFTFCYNISPHSTFKNKYTPFELMFGRQPNNLKILNNAIIDPLYNHDNYALEFKHRLQTAFKNANQLIIEAKNRNKQIFDKNCNPSNIKIGDKIVTIREQRTKLDPLYNGPFQVIKILHPNIEILDINTGKTKIIHKNNCRKYIT